MVVDIIIFEEPEEDQVHDIEKERFELTLYKLGLSVSDVRSLNFLESLKDREFIETNIPQVLLSQILDNCLPYISPFERAVKKIQKDIKKYFVAVTVQKTVTVSVFSEETGVEFEMNVPPNKQINILSFKFFIKNFVVNKNKQILLESDEKTVKLCKRFIDLIKISSYFDNQIKEEIKFENTVSTVSAKSVKKDKSIFEKIFEFYSNFDSDDKIRYQYFNSKILDNYYVYKAFGANDKRVKEMFDEHKEIIENRKIYAAQQKSNWNMRILNSFRDSFAVKKFKKKYDSLSRADKKIIDDFVEKNMKIKKAQDTEGNKLAKIMTDKLYTFNNAEIKSDLDKLCLYLGIKDSEDSGKKLLKDEICPHTVYSGFLALKNYNNMIEKIDGIRNGISEKYGHQELLGEVTCEICGEILEDNKGIDISVVSFKESVSEETKADELYIDIRNELLIIISRYLIIGKSYKIQLNKLIEALVPPIYSEVSKIKADLAKSRTMNFATLERIITVHIYIYIFASICQLVFLNSDISFAPISSVRLAKKKSGGKGALPEKENKNVKDRIENAMKTGKDRLINILNTGIEFVQQLQRVNIEESEYLNQESIKPLFLKAYKWVNGLNYTSSSEKKYKLEWEQVMTPIIYYFSIYDEVNVLGRPKDQILAEIREKSIYDTIQMPEVTTSKHRKESLELLYFFLHNKIYRQYVFPTSHDMKVLMEKGAVLKKREKDFEEGLIKKRFIYPIPRVKFRTLVKPYRGEDRCRCKDRKVKAGKKEYTKEDIQKLLAEKKTKELDEYFSSDREDAECVSKCYNSRYILSTEKSNFFNYYTNSCPEGDFHEFENKICKKCKLHMGKLENDYYKKYKDKYRDIQKKIRLDIEHKLKKSFEKVTFTDVKPPEKTIINDKLIREFSTDSGISFNSIMNLGLYYGFNGKDIEKGNVNPFSTLSVTGFINQNNVLAGYFGELLKNYYLVKYSEFMATLPPKIQTLLENINNKGFSKKMPDIGLDVLKVYRSMGQSFSGREKSIYLLNEICNFILQAKKTSLGEILYKFLIGVVFGTEKNYLKFIPKVGKSLEEADDSAGADIDQIADVEKPDDEEENSDGEPANDFSQDNLDMDIEDEEDENLLVEYGEY